MFVQFFFFAIIQMMCFFVCNFYIFLRFTQNFRSSGPFVFLIIVFEKQYKSNYESMPRNHQTIKRQCAIDRTKLFLNMTGFVLLINEFVLNKTVIVLNFTVFAPAKTVYSLKQTVYARHIIVVASNLTVCFHKYNSICPKQDRFPPNYLLVNPQSLAPFSSALVFICNQLFSLTIRI